MPGPPSKMLPDPEARPAVGMVMTTVKLPPAAPPKPTSTSTPAPVPPAPPATASQDGPPRSATTAATPTLAVPGDPPPTPPAQQDARALGRYVGIGVVVGVVGCCLAYYLFRLFPWRANESSPRRRFWAANGHQGSRSILRWPGLVRGLYRRLQRQRDADRLADVHELPAENNLP